MKNFLIKLFITIIIGSVIYYFLLPPINLSSPLFWVFSLGLVFLFLMMLSLESDSKQLLVQTTRIKENTLNVVWGVYLIIFIIPFILLFIGCPIFNSKKYANRIEITDASFKDDVETVNFSSLPLLDKDSSRKLGDRVMGGMTELVSQFAVSDLYTQINYNDDIVRVTPLEYASVIKYFTNNKEGVKGYIVVNSVTGKANLVKLDKGMQYMPSSLFSKDLMRHLRFNYPTKIFGNANFEIDNEGKPYWIVPTVKYTFVGLRREIEGAIILDAVTGESKFYKVKDIPTWVDHVYPADLIMEQTDNHGTYQNGFINSIIGQKGVVVTTDGYNYVASNDDIYLYTGITSVTNDESILGFIMTNLRTKETKFYSVSGAKEESAMASAEGQVQQMKYTSTFPLLINLNDKPTYFLSLKDNAGLVKMYGFIDVEDYQKVVVTDASLGIEEAVSNYLNGEILESDDLEEKEIEIDSIVDAVLDGLTYYYIVDTDGNKCKVSIKVADNSLPFMNEGDKISISYKEKNNILEIVKINS